MLTNQAYSADLLTKMDPLTRIAATIGPTAEFF